MPLRVERVKLLTVYQPCQQLLGDTCEAHELDTDSYQDGRAGVTGGDMDDVVSGASWACRCMRTVITKYVKRNTRLL